MPKAPMSAEEVAMMRGRILDTALDIIIDQGFENLSVRKIASRIGVTATTIYNYYKNKDELNLMIRLRGFSALHDLLLRRAKPFDKPEDRMVAMIKGYAEFGIDNSSYYEIMFNLNTPKYLDYRGTPIEELATREKQVALACMALFTETISEHVSDLKDDRAKYIWDQVVMFWSDLHGMVTLRNSRLFHEVIDDVDAFVERRINDVIERIFLIKQKLDIEMAEEGLKTDRR